MNKRQLLGALALCISVCSVCAGCQSKQQAQELAIQKKNAALPHAQFMASFSQALAQHTNGRGMGGAPTAPTTHPMAPKAPGQSAGGPAPGQ